MSNISVNVSGGTNVVVAVGGTLSSTPLTALQVTAGANITITTTSGVYTFIGPNVPVQSVNGQTGHIVVSGGTGSIASVNGKTGTVVLTSTDVSAASVSHTHVAANITNLTSVANVVSVNGITGTPAIVGGVGVTVSTSGSSITIEAAGSTSGGGAALSNALPQGFGAAAAGTSGLASRADHVHPMPTAADVGAASAVHTHVAASITDFTSVANVVSVNGKTGTVSLVASDVTAAAASHGHAYVTGLNGQTGTLSIVAGNNVTVSTSANTITIAAPAPGDALPSQSGNASRVLATDGTAASWATRYSVVEPVLVAGGGIAFSKDTAAGSITIESLGGIVGNTAASVSTKSLSSSQNDYDAGAADIVRLSPSSAVTLTGLAGGVDGVVRVLYNIGTHVVTLASGSTQSQATNRFSIVSGNIALDEGDSSSVWYDGTSQRWRVLEDQVAGGGSGSGGGIAMSYLFG